MFYFWGNVRDHWTPSSLTAAWSPWIFVRFILHSLGYSPWGRKELDMTERLSNSGTHVSYQGLHLPILARLIWLTCRQYSGPMWCFVKCPDDPEDSFVLYYDWGCRVNIALRVKVLVIQLCLTLWDPLDCSPPGSSVHGDSPSKNIGVGCHSLLQRIFPTQGLNPGLLNCRWIVYHLSHQGSPVLLALGNVPYVSDLLIWLKSASKSKLDLLSFHSCWLGNEYIVISNYY